MTDRRIVLATRLDPEDYREVERRAGDAGKTLSEWTRERLSEIVRYEP